MTQYITKRGLQKLGDRGVASVEKEVRHLPTMDAIEPYNTKYPMKEYQHASLGYLVFLKEKCDGSIKGKVCYGGCKQQDYMTNE